MARLPVVGGDVGDWGTILNDFLEVSLNQDGSIQTSALQAASGVTSVNAIAPNASGNVTLTAANVGAVPSSSVGSANGVASLNSSSLVPSAQLGTGSPSSSTYLRGDGSWSTPSGSGSGSLASDSDVAIVSPAGGQVLTYNTGDSKWENEAPAVASVFGRTGAVTAQNGDYTATQVTGAAPLASPALTGTPIAPTAPAGTNSTQIATTAYADSAVGTVSALTPSDWRNVVTGYGADPTGEDDSTTAIQNAIDAVSTTGGTVYFPAGNYKISSALTVRKNITLMGADSGLYTEADTPQPVTVITQTSATAHGFVGEDLGNLTISGIALAGPGSGSGDGIHLTWSTYTNTPFLSFLDLLVYGFGGDGINVQTALAAVLRRVQSRSNGGNGYNFTDICTTLVAESCWAVTNGAYGWYLDQVNYSTLIGCASQANTTAGYYIDICESLVLSACGSEGDYDGFVLVGNNSIKLEGLWIYGNQHYGVHVEAGNYRVLLDSIFESTPDGATYSIYTESGSSVTLVNCGGVTTATSLNSGGAQITIDSGSIAAGNAVTGETVMASGLSGATGAGRYVGSSFGGAPTSGTFAAGDFMPDHYNGCVWICTTAGSPGTWAQTAGLNSPIFTGTPTAPTASALTNSTQLATTAYTDSAVAVETSRAEAAEALFAPKASPIFSGTAQTSNLEVFGELLLESPASFNGGGKTLANIGNGSASTDAAAYGQTPAGGNTATIGQGGTGQTTAAAAYNALSPMTTKGDMEYDSSGGTAARLPIGTATGSTGDFLGVSSGVPAWQQVSGQYVCTPTSYAPASVTTLTVNSTTMAAWSSANVNTGSFTAPASGSVVVTASFAAIEPTGSGIVTAFGLAAHGTTSPMIGNAVLYALSTSFVGGCTVPFLVTGLTPGDSYNFDLMGCCTSSDSVTIKAFGQSTTTPNLAAAAGPVIMTVQAV